MGDYDLRRMLSFPDVQIRQAKDSRRLDRTRRAGTRGDIPHLVDAETVYRLSRHGVEENGQEDSWKIP